MIDFHLGSETISLCIDALSKGLILSNKYDLIDIVMVAERSQDRRFW